MTHLNSLALLFSNIHLTDGNIHFLKDYFHITPAGKMESLLHSQKKCMDTINGRFKELGLKGIDTEAGFNAVFRLTLGAHDPKGQVDAMAKYGKFLKELERTAVLDFANFRGLIKSTDTMSRQMDQILMVMDGGLRGGDPDTQYAIVLFYINAMRNHPYFTQ